MPHPDEYELGLRRLGIAPRHLRISAYWHHTLYGSCETCLHENFTEGRFLCTLGQKLFDQAYESEDE